MRREQEPRRAGRPGAGRRRVGLKWKIIGGFLSGVILFGLLVVVVVTYQMSRVVRTQLDQRALDIATNLGDSAAAYVLRGSVLELYALATKYSLSPAVAYALIKDRKGGVVAHSLGTFPPELRDSLTPGGRQPDRREFSFRGRTVYETTMPILDGQAGAVSVAMWGDSVDREVQRTVLPIIGLIAVALAASLIFSLFLTRRITRRLLRLKEMADKVSMGDLEVPVGIESNDEIGDLANSLERMRASLKAAMVRLSRAG